MVISARFYRVIDVEENRTIFVCTDLGHMHECLKSYFDPCVWDSIDGLVHALLNGSPACDFESYLGISVNPFFDNLEV